MYRSASAGGILDARRAGDTVAATVAPSAIAVITDRFAHGITNVEKSAKRTVYTLYDRMKPRATPTRIPRAAMNAISIREDCRTISRVNALARRGPTCCGRSTTA